MTTIQNVFSIRNKEKRYDKFLDWIFKEIFQNKGAILELNEFSEKRKVRKNGKKLLATLVFSKNPESSAFIGPSVTFRIFEKQNNKVWRIDLITKPFMNQPTINKDIDFEKFINSERAKILKEFIWK